jgi:23S rRNA pseudouridine2605 synthase
MQIRLNKFIAESGYTSRRNADLLISSGKVKVNGSVALLGQPVDPTIDKIEISGQILAKAPKIVYYALYKPKGIVSTAKDELNRKSVIDLVPKEPRVYPIGRLDVASEGLIILTNDGELTQTLTHPSYEHEKEYEVEARVKNYELRIKGEIDQKILKQVQDDISCKFLSGLQIDDKLMKADSIAIIPNSEFIILNIVLHTGYNRQIRKMCDKIGLDVKKLVRIRVGNLSLNSLKLKSGEYKEINKSQIV